MPVRLRCPTWVQHTLKIEDDEDEGAHGSDQDHPAHPVHPHYFQHRRLHGVVRRRREGGGARRAGAGLALGAAPRPPRTAPRSRHRRTRGRPRPAPGGVNAALGVTTPRARRRGALRARGGGGPGEEPGRSAPSPSPRAEMVPPGDSGGRGRAGRPRWAMGPRLCRSRPLARSAAAVREAPLPVNLTTCVSLSLSSGARGPAAAGEQEHPPLLGSVSRSVCGEKFSFPGGACLSVVPVASLTLNASLQVRPRSAGYVAAGPCRRVLPVSRCPGRELFILSAVQTPTSGARNHPRGKQCHLA